MHNVVVMKVCHSIQHLTDDLGGIFLSEFSVLADAIKQLSSGSKLGDDVVFVL